MNLAHVAKELRETGVHATHNDLCIEVVDYYEDGWLLLHIIPWAADAEVPVLYFQAFNKDNDPVLDWAQGNEKSIDVTRTVHPINQTSAWFVHPCNTRTWLETMSPYTKITDPKLVVLWFNGLRYKLRV